MQFRLAVFILLMVCLSTIAFAEELPYGALARFGQDTLDDVRYLPDGNLVISTSKGIKILNAEDGAVMREFTPAEDVGRIAVSPDGKLVANWSLMLWDTATGTRVGDLPGESSGVFVFSPDGRLIAGDNKDNHDQVSLWDVPEHKLLLRLEDKRKDSLPSVVQVRENGISRSSGPPRTNALAFSRDGKLLAVASRRTVVEIWDIDTGKIWRELEGHESWIESVAYSPDGKWLVSSERLGRVILWDAKTLTPVWTKDIDVSPELLFAPDSQTLIVNSRYNVQLWDVNEGRQRELIPINPDEVRVSPEGKRLAIIDGVSGGILVWDMPSSSLALSVNRYIGYSYDRARLVGRYFAIAAGAYIKIWDIGSQKIVRIIEIESSPAEYDISPDGKMLAVLQIRSQEIHLWNLMEGKKVASLKVSLLDDEFFLYYSDLKFNERGNILAFGTSGSPITLWVVSLPKVIGRLGKETGGCRKLLFSRDGNRLAQSRLSSVVLWDIKKREPIDIIGLHSMVFAFNLKGDFLTVERSEREIKVWNNSTNKLLLTIDGPSRHATTFSPDGAILVTVTREGLEFWDVEKAQSLMKLEGYYSPKFSQDGSLLMTMGEYPTIWIWDFDALLRRARSIQPREKEFATLGELKSAMLLQNYPNPSNPETWMPFILPQSTPVKMIISDVIGRRIRQLDLGIQESGAHFTREDAAYWDGKNESGEPVASGIYFYTLKTPDVSPTRRMVIIR